MTAKIRGGEIWGSLGLDDADRIWADVARIVGYLQLAYYGYAGKEDRDRLLGHFKLWGLLKEPAGTEIHILERAVNESGEILRKLAMLKARQPSQQDNRDRLIDEVLTEASPEKILIQAAIFATDKTLVTCEKHQQQVYLKKKADLLEKLRDLYPEDTLVDEP